MRFILFASVVAMAAPACGDLAAVASAGEEARRIDSGAFAIAAGDLLDVETPFGSIAVEARAVGTDGPPPLQGTFEATISAGAPTVAEAEAVLARYRIEAERSGSTVRVRLAGAPLETREHGVRTSREATASFRLTVPAGVRLLARSGSGAVSAVGPLAAVDALSQFGAVKVRGIRGPVRLESGSGAVEAEDPGVGDADLSSRFGPVRLRGGRGAASLRTGSGSVEVSDREGRVQAASEFGSVSVSGVLSALHATTGSGGVAVRALRGSRAADTWIAESRFGPVDVEVPLDFDAEVRAETEFGRVTAAHPALTGSSQSSDSQFAGTLGAGGAILRLKSGSGSVALRGPR